MARSSSAGRCDSWALAGIPDVDDQRCADDGACSRTSVQVFCLKVRFSGPCSWMMVACWTAEDSVLWRVSRLLEMREGMDGVDDLSDGR